MSVTFIVMTMLLSSSLAIAFVLQPSKEEPATSANSPVAHHRYHGESLQSIRKALLRALNLRAEPQLPAGGLDAIRAQWQSTFSNILHRAKNAAVAPLSVSPADGNSSSLKCCPRASEIFMTDLGWDNWVIHPSSLTIVHCALCNPGENTVQCPSSHTHVQDGDSQVQVPHCQPTSREQVDIVYMDEYSSVVMSSVDLTRSCGCGLGDIQQPSKE
ncbi:LOW QUALITY PROTEIN: gonadal somatic cell derived factor [Lates calcarifer]|uniref:LOW QUALITY PROTEIN: gonadal somatic cell derived factor n=1 Tax=Lates calcarifer TaxID=8187 RepID=A0AAJ7LBW3_LATCA|nr:LOW QUALITY PROTEIN: gonadal somatic cell derived factor [Lates calcarifer]